MKRRNWIVFAVCVLLLAPAAVAAQSDGAQDAREAAESWLALIDDADYTASWEEAARPFQQAVSAGAWAEQLTAARGPVGTVQERELARSQPVTNPPGAPPGEYMQLLYQSTYSGAGRVSENVVLVQDGDRGWRVTGYFIQPAG